MADFIFEIFRYDFMVRAFIAGVMIAVIAPLIGIFLVIRRYSLMADTLAHVSLVGVAVGMLTGNDPVVTATVTSVISAAAIEKVRLQGKIFGESVLALFLSASLAVASVLISMARGYNVNVLSYLFGSITTVGRNDIYFIAGLGVVVLVTLAITYRQMFFISFNEDLAKANGIDTGKYNMILIVLAALTVSLSMRIVGVLLIGALMVIPVITAIQFGKSFRKTLMMAVGFSLLSVIIGLYSSYWLDLASGGTIVVVALVFFLAGMVLNRKK
jgi:zinc transport system permease protein